MKHTIEHYFPEGRIVTQESVFKMDAAYVYFPLGDDSVWQVKQTDLTERERMLLYLLPQSQVSESHHPWKSYLLNSQPSPMKDLPALQFLFVHLCPIEGQSQPCSEWLEMMQGLFPNQLAVFSENARDYVFVLSQQVKTDTRSLLEATLSMMEFDFGMRMTVVVGQIWSENDKDAIPRLFQAERGLFQRFYREHPHSTLLSFGHLFLWGYARALEEIRYLSTVLSQMIHKQEGLQQLILALWEEGAVLTKAAQKLYLHRNTLQYRLDKWEALTGLQLKHLTDLTVCYFAVIDSTF